MNSTVVIRITLAKKKFPKSSKVSSRVLSHLIPELIAENVAGLKRKESAFCAKSKKGALKFLQTLRRW